MEALCVIFGCVAANHLGLVSAIEKKIGRTIPIIGCTKCLTFWISLVVCFPSHNLVSTIAIAFLSSYAAIWLELAMGMLDNLYMYLYGTFCYKGDTDNAVATDSADSRKGCGSTLSAVRERKKPKKP